MINPEKILAIIIGVENYDSMHPLPAATANAVTFRRTLTSHLGIPSSNIYTEINPQKGADVLEEIEQKVDKDFKWELIIFYYAGHGVKSDNQLQYYLATKATNPNRPSTHGINLETLVSEYLNTTRLWMILDCCFSGKAFDAAQGKHDYFYMASSAQNQPPVNWPVRPQRVLPYSAFRRLLQFLFQWCR